MIFSHAIRREFTHTASGVGVALMAVALSIQLIRLLNEAAGGRVAPEGVLVLLGFSTLRALPIMLALTGFVAILLTLSRLYRDSEMVIWFSSGQPLTAWIAPVFRFALPLALVIGLLNIVVSPWAGRLADNYRRQLSARSEISQVSPGTFRETTDGTRVFFVEKLAEEKDNIEHIFIASTQKNKMGIMVADQGFQETQEDGSVFIVLQAGRHYEVEPGSAAFQISLFDRYKVLVKESPMEEPALSNSRMSLSDLLSNKSISARAELLTRIGLPISALVLAFLAIPLSFVNPRASRSANFLIAILIYAIYNNLLSMSDTFVSQGRLSFLMGLWLVHLIILLPVFFLFYWRMSVRKPWKIGKKAD